MLSSLLAKDGYLPRQFASLGDRLVYSNGILILSGLSMGLLIAFQGDTHALLPLYALGVFLSFTLSQLGMVRRWSRLREPRWVHHAAINLLGAVVTAIVLGGGRHHPLHRRRLDGRRRDPGARPDVLHHPTPLCGNGSPDRRLRLPAAEARPASGRRPSCGNEPRGDCRADVRQGDVAQRDRLDGGSGLHQHGAPPDALERMGARRSPGGAGIPVPIGDPARSSITSTRWRNSGTATT